jgi:prolyl-tRNA synthetase
MATEEMEAVAMQQEQQAHMLHHVAYEAAAAELAVHIEEVHDSGASTSPEAAAL